MMTFEEFQADCFKQNDTYLREETTKIKKAHKLWLKYAASMQKLGLHALDRNEIDLRRRELDIRSQYAPENLQDGPVMRFSYENYLKRTAA